MIFYYTERANLTPDPGVSCRTRANCYKYKRLGGARDDIVQNRQIVRYKLVSIVLIGEFYSARCQ